MYKIVNLTILILLHNCMFTLFPQNRYPHLVEYTISGKDRDKILIIPVEGLISDQRKDNFLQESTESALTSITEKLATAKNDPDIRAVILKINSPGGTVTSSDIIYTEIKKFRAARNIPVYSVFMDTATSGAYYIAMATDHITAHPTTITGSIGIIINSLNLKNGLDKLGIKDQSISSGKNKQIGSPLTEMTEEQNNILQSVVNSLYNRFFDIVMKGRSMKRSELEPLADGRIFTAEQALKNRLVDNIGYFDDALKILLNDKSYRMTPGNINPRIIAYTYRPGSTKNIYNTPSSGSGVYMKSYLYYLWSPAGAF